MASHLRTVHKLSSEERPEKTHGLKGPAKQNAKKKRGQIPAISPVVTRSQRRTRAMKRKQTPKQKDVVENKRRRTRGKKNDNDLDSETSNSVKNEYEEQMVTNQTGDVPMEQVGTTWEEKDDQQLEDINDQEEKGEYSDMLEMDNKGTSSPKCSPGEVNQDRVDSEITHELTGDLVGVSGGNDQGNEPNPEIGSSTDATCEGQLGRTVDSSSAEGRCDDDDHQPDSLIVDTSKTDTTAGGSEGGIDRDGTNQIREYNISNESVATSGEDSESIVEDGQSENAGVASMQGDVDRGSILEREGKNKRSLAENGSLDCELCGKSFKSHFLVQDHMVTAHFKCTTCGKVLRSKSSLTRHVNGHKNQATGVLYTCSVCLKTFIDKYVHATHEKTHFAEKKECEICHRKFNSSRSLSRHSNSKHTQMKQYPCDTCGKVFYIEYDLKRHVNRRHTQDEVRICEICGKSFYNVADLHVHEKNVHVASGQHLCELCGAAYKSKGSLKQHHLTAHTDCFKYSCDICGKKFKRSSHVNAHRRVHTNYRPFRCQKCGKGFRNHTQLDVHLNWHYNIRPFACQVCDKTFLTKGNLDKHQSVHTKVYKYTCEQCKRGFADLSQFRHHLMKAHGIRVPTKMTKGVPESVAEYIPEQTFTMIEIDSKQNLKTLEESEQTFTMVEIDSKQNLKPLEESAQNFTSAGLESEQNRTPAGLESEQKFPVGEKSQSLTVYEEEATASTSVEGEPQPALIIEDHPQRILESVPMIEVVIDCETSSHDPAVDTVTSQVTIGDDNIIATEALVAMMNSQGIQ